MSEGELKRWALSLDSLSRAFEAENLSSIKIVRRGIRHPLQLALLALQLVRGSEDFNAKGGGVGTPGFTLENTEKALSLDNPVLVREHIAEVILGQEGETLREALRKDSSDDNKAKAGEMIRRIKYQDASESEIHAVEFGNDVLAASWISGTRHASPYSDIAREIDQIIGKYDNVIIARLIAQYSGLKIEGDNVVLTSTQNDAFGAKIREFATIQIAEKGREIRTAKQSGVDGRRKVEQALENVAENGFHNVYEKNSVKLALFARVGGQEYLRVFYEGVAEGQNQKIR